MDYKGTLCINFEQCYGIHELMSSIMGDFCRKYKSNTECALLQLVSAVLTVNHLLLIVIVLNRRFEDVYTKVRRVVECNLGQ